MATETTDKAPGVDTLAMEFATLLDVTAERLREMDRKDLACGLPDAARHMRKMAQRGVTEREAVERERIAFRWGWNKRDDVAETGHRYQQERERQMVERYPLPKVTRPRVVRIGAYEFRACGERIEERFANEGANWREASAFPLTAHNVNTWADLLANPTEEVDDA